MKLVRKEKKNEPFFLDTSGVIKIYHQEKGTDEFTKYLSKISEELFFTTSDITR